MVCAAIFLSLVFLPSQALSNDVIFEEDVARAIYVELATCADTDAKVQSLINKYNLEDTAEQLLVDNLSSRLSLLENQIDDEHARAEQYRTEWKACGEALIKCQQSKPSRMTWFGSGLGTGLGIALLILLL